MVGSVLFVGSIMALLVFSRMGDLYGKKVIILGTNIILVPVLIGLMISTNIWTMYYLIFCVGFCFGGCSIL